MYRQRRNNAHGSGTGPSASWRECTRTRAPARTASSSGEYLQPRDREGARERSRGYISQPFIFKDLSYLFQIKMKIDN